MNCYLGLAKNEVNSIVHCVFIYLMEAFYGHTRTTTEFSNTQHHNIGRVQLFGAGVIYFFRVSTNNNVLNVIPPLFCWKNTHKYL